MKSTFPASRKLVNGKFPYVVIMPDMTTKYLFEVTRNTTLREIIDIERKFTDDELVFASIDPKCGEQTSTMDAANLYELGGRKQRPFYYYALKEFHEMIPATINDRKALEPICRVVDITCDDLPF